MIVQLVNRLSHNLFTLMWIVTFRSLYCWSSSGDGVDWMCISISSTLVVCDWCISILIVLIRRCLLKVRLWYRSDVVLIDRGHPLFWNFISGIPIDVVRMKSHVNGCTGVPVCVCVCVCAAIIYTILNQ